MQVTMTINGREVTEDVEPRMLLVHFIRDQIGLTGTHWGCDTSNCGTCVVLVDGQPVKSCTTLAAMTGGHEVTTVEGLEVDGELDVRRVGCREEPDSVREDRCFFLLLHDRDVVERRVLDRGEMLSPLPSAAQVVQTGSEDAHN